MHYQFYAITSCGGYRTKNEDRVMVDGNLLKNGEMHGEANDRLLAVVCDGVGGSSDGAKAADIAASCLRDACEAKQDPLSFCSALYRADDEVKAEQAANAKCADMKTTIAAIYIDQFGYLAYNAGDTRIYRLNSEGLDLLSVDHTLENEMVNKDSASFDEQQKAIYTNTITRFLGASKTDLKLNIAGDVSTNVSFGTFLLCTDGAYKGIPDELIAEVLNLKTMPLMDRGRLLFELAEESGTRDNISLVLVDVNEDEQKLAA